MSDADAGLWGSPSAGRALAHLPAGHLHTMDYSTWSEVLVEAAAQGHVLRPLHQAEEGATMYVACERCANAAWRVQRLAVCRAQTGLARPCKQAPHGEDESKDQARQGGGP